MATKTSEPMHWVLVLPAEGHLVHPQGAPMALLSHPAHRLPLSKLLALQASFPCSLTQVMTKNPHPGHFESSQFEEWGWIISFSALSF